MVYASGSDRGVHSPVSHPVDVLVVIDEVLCGSCEHCTDLKVEEMAYKEAYKCIDEIWSIWHGNLDAHRG